MVGVSIRKHSSRAGFHHQVHGPEYWYLRRGARIVNVYFTEKIQTVWPPFFFYDFISQNCFRSTGEEAVGYWTSLTKFAMFWISAGRVRGKKLSLLPL